ncbi:RHS repeat domain-containing protein [Ralstonia pseudosolanacearum]
MTQNLVTPAGSSAEQRGARWLLLISMGLLLLMSLYTQHAHARWENALPQFKYVVVGEGPAEYGTPQEALSVFIKAFANPMGLTVSGFHPCRQAGNNGLNWGLPGAWCVDFTSGRTDFYAVSMQMHCPILWQQDSRYQRGTGTADDAAVYEPVCYRWVDDAQCPEGSCHGQGDPIFPEDSTYRLSDIDYVDPRGTLSFERYYNSSQQTMGMAIARSILPPYQSGSAPQSSVSTTALFSAQRDDGRGYSTFQYLNTATNLVQAVRPGGLVYRYQWDGATATAASRSTHDVLSFSYPSSGAASSTTTSIGQWTVRRAATDEIELYDANGVLQKIQYRNGQMKVLSYSDSNTPSSIAPGPGYLVGITDSFGKSLSLRYDDYGRLVALIDPVGQAVTYGYELVRPDWSCTRANCFRIKTVTYQDGKTKIYHWDEVDYNGNTSSSYQYQYNLLTGVTDENGQRYSTIRYDGSGSAVSTELAGGVLHYYFAKVQGGGPIVTVVDPLGAQRVFKFITAAGLLQLSSVTGAPCDDCGPATAKYDANGNVASQTDFNGSVTCFGYDLNRNLETVRVEGLPAGTTCPSSLDSYTIPAGARKISTQWHPVWRQPIKVAVPKQITTYVFNGDGGQYCAPTTAKVDSIPIGVICSRSEQATLDANGNQGFGGSLVGVARLVQATYDGDGQALTVKGSRTDVNDQLSFGYRKADDTATPPQYRRGDLASVTDALGHVTTINQTDANGRPLKVTDPNGTAITLGYSPRGWLASQTMTSASGSAQTTTYGYDNAGQLIKVTWPDSSFVAFSYDGAHRMTGVSDSLGNSIVYTLDAMGNRVQEQATDSSGTLTRQITRAINSINRLQKFTVGNAL